MGVVSDYLRALVEKQVNEKGLVVWFDPERQYSVFVRELVLSGTGVAVYKDSFLELRHKIDSQMSGDAPPHLVVYVPTSEEATQDALIELVVAGVVMKPGQSSLPRNTRLSVVARAALKETHTPADLEAIARQVEAGKLTLSDLDRLASERGRGGGGVLSTIFGTSDPRKIALEFLGSARYDPEITSRRAADEIAQILSGEFGLPLEKEDSSKDRVIEQQRSNLARYALLTEFVASLHGPTPPALAGVKIASEEGSRASCVSLAKEWRLRRDLRDSYARYASKLSGELRALTATLTPEQLGSCETFAEVEAQLQSALETRLAQQTEWRTESAIAMHSIIDARLAGFWSSWPEQYPEVPARWQIISSALDVLTTADKIEMELKTVLGGPAGLLKRYTDEWCMLDTYHRYLERRCHLFDFDSDSRHKSTEKLIARARQRYMEIGGSLAEAFVRALERTRFTVPDYRRQLETYSTFVRPAVSEGKTAYVLVDALRYEMARELAQSLHGDFGVKLSAVLGTPPTITPIGMAALMPGAEVSATVVALGGGALALSVEGTVLKDRTGRVEWFRGKHNGTVAVEKLEDVLLSFKEARKSELRSADVILVTSQEIDQAGENATVRAARRAMEEILGDLARLVHKLRDYGCKQIIITADHGYVFADEPDSDMKVAPPTGQRMSLHSRAWIGKGGANDPAFLRTRLSSFGLDDSQDLEIAVPYGFGVFITPGGGGAYYHGGMSPQEMVIPVLVLTPRVTGAVPLTQVNLSISMGSKKISTRFCSIQVTGLAASLMDVKPPRVRAEIRGSGEIVSRAVSASYGFFEATGDVLLEFKEGEGSSIVPNTITLMITQESLPTSVSLHLIDSATGLELATIPNIEVAISI